LDGNSYVPNRLPLHAGFLLPSNGRRNSLASGSRAMILRASVALDAGAIARCVRRIAREIAEHHGGIDNLALIGIVRRGANLAERIAALLDENPGAPVPVGTLDISSYRDDGKGVAGDPRLLGRYIPFSLDSRQVVLVDDVLYTGRTVRAALTALADLGRPESVELAALVDRGERELPIRADYVGRNIAAPEGQRVYVRLSEVDGVDAVLIGEQKPEPSPAKDRAKGS
jgi:pyrimidine operon attenuation protein / uracil phosphoribosyltransferase